MHGQKFLPTSWPSTSWYRRLDLKSQKEGPGRKRSAKVGQVGEVESQVGRESKSEEESEEDNEKELEEE